MRRKNSLIMSPISIIVGVFLFVALILLIGSLVEPTLEKLGMETRSHLKSELSKSKDVIKQLNSTIEELQKQKEVIATQCKIKEDVINDYQKEVDELDSFIKEITTNNQLKEPIINKDLIKTEPIGEVEISKEDLSRNNIVAIHDVYNSLFGG